MLELIDIMRLKPTISIIIPVYGVERYIAKCIESIKRQTFTDFEAILINDGTKDGSIQAAREMIGEDDRFIILCKENGGQGSARNMGLDYAKGDYIAFIDSDDYVDSEYLQKMYKQITLSGSEVCTCNVLYVDENGISIKEHINYPEKYIDNNDYLLAMSYISGFMCDKLFSSSVFSGMRFDERVRTYEDAHFVFKLIYNKKITKVDGFLYNYLQRVGSTCNSLPKTFIKDRVAVKNTQNDFVIINKLPLNSDYMRYVYLKTFVFFCVVHIARYSNDYSRHIKVFMREVDKSQFRLKDIFFIFAKERKVGLSLLLFKISPLMFMFFSRFWFRNNTA